MEGSIPASVIAELAGQAEADPQLPRQNPSVSFWQLPPHPTLSEVQSEELPEATDYAILGSGVTGCSITKTLLEASAQSSKASSVTIFEARTLTSGATGRNGGVLASFVPGDYKLLSERFGHDEAVKIARFANQTLEKMHQIANSSEDLREASEVRRTQDVLCFEDDDAFLQAQESQSLYEEHVPEERNTVQYLTAQEAASKYNVKAAAGAMIIQAGAFWPYRLITRLWAHLYAKHRSRLSIETNTPVTEISYDPATNSTHPYVLHTPRGLVRASKIIHATNGYTGHLVPGLRGKIYPLRGTMSTQKAPPEFGRHGHGRSWGVVSSGNYDGTTGLLETGLYYGNQNPKTGDIFFGGEKVKINEALVSDDTIVAPSSLENICTVLPRYFINGWKEGEEPEVRRVWSGIMGFTADRLPLVGSLPVSITKRGEEHGEWIAAGFNGYGMPLCWSCGEAVAKRLLGQDDSDIGLPQVFLATEARLHDHQRMATLPALEMLFGGHP
ncbi:FAD dependent oxidoreductase [Exophiala viscosa]|uniref:FAD dependent oxidoreductase n=1 Tax=Exophiala viscosa TaxID=2486360 RepID=A0AAN6DW74_9EURO|nr:FAD dependent oxidoreductase [Exophiala viscosa]